MLEAVKLKTLPAKAKVIVNITIQALKTLATVIEVEDLQKDIIQGDLQLNLVTCKKLKKLTKGSTEAITNAKIQSITNAELLTAKEVKKRRNKRLKEKNGRARVLDAELLQERQLD